MMEFSVKKNGVYVELTIITDNVSIKSGLLDKNEALDLAKELIFGAEQLLPEKKSEIEQRLYEVRKDL